jgi:hypothetical protein
MGVHGSKGEIHERSPLGRWPRRGLKERDEGLRLRTLEESPGPWLRLTSENLLPPPPLRPSQLPPPGYAFSLKEDPLEPLADSRNAPTPLSFPPPASSRLRFQTLVKNPLKPLATTRTSGTAPTALCACVQPVYPTVTSSPPHSCPPQPHHSGYDSRETVGRVERWPLTVRLCALWCRVCVRASVCVCVCVCVIRAGDGAGRQAGEQADEQAGRQTEQAGGRSRPTDKSNRATEKKDQTRQTDRQGQTNGPTTVMLTCRWVWPVDGRSHQLRAAPPATDINHPK